MKKFFALLLAVLLVVGCFAGCTDKQKPNSHAEDVVTPAINGVSGSSGSDATFAEDDFVEDFGSSGSNVAVEEETEDISSSSNAG